MATLPVFLPPGYILVYGEAQYGSGGLTPGNRDIVFGSVYQIWDGGATYVYGGDNVMYNKNDVLIRLATSPTEPFQYSMIPARLVTKDIPEV